MVRGRLIKSGSRGKWSAASRERSRARRERARRLLLLPQRLLVLLLVVLLLRVAVAVTTVAVAVAAILATGETRFAGVTCRRHHPVSCILPILFTLLTYTPGPPLSSFAHPFDETP